tara:strand:- start:52 stop:675 length:624 start_codon:yes stop_codon:yes gene_type:complete
MAKSFKVKRGTYKRENLKIGSPITILTSVDLKLQESINNNCMVEAIVKESEVPRVGVIGLGQKGKDLCLKLRSKGIQVSGNDVDVEMSRKFWEKSVRNVYDPDKTLKPIWDYSRSLENLIDQLKQPRAYPDSTFIDRSVICFICTPSETVDSIKSELMSLLSNKDIIVDCTNKKILILLDGDKSGFIKPQPVEIPFSCLEILLETFN